MRKKWGKGAILLLAMANAAWGQIALPPSIDAGAIQRRTMELEQQLREEQEPPPTVQHPLEKGKVLQPERGGKAAVRFLVKRIEFSASQILSREELAAVAAEFENRELSMDELQGLLDKVNQLYRSKGVITSQAVLPPQDIVDGVVRIRLVEGRLGQLSVDGNATTRGGYISAWIKQNPGDLPDVAALERDLIRFNRTNDAQVAVELKPGKQFGETDIYLRVAEPPRHDLRFFADNNGSHATGEIRRGVTYQNRSLFGIRDNLGLTYTQADGHDGYGLSYALPINTWGTRVAGSYNFDKTHIRYGPFRALNITGEAQTYGVDVKHPLYFDNSRYLEGVAGFRNRRVSSWISELLLQRTDTKDGHAGVEWQSVDGGGFWNASLYHHIGESETVGGQGKQYRITRGNVRRVQELGHGWSIRGAYNFQATPNTLLPSSEQIMIGGDGTVRGYETGLYSGDKGFVVNLELHHPLPSVVNALKTSGYFFVDHGVVKPFRPVGSERGKDEITGAGWGMNLGVSDWLTARLSFGFALRDKFEEKHGFYVNAQIVAAAF